MRKISKFSAVLLIVIASLTVVTGVLCAVLWSAEKPSSITITSSVNAAIYNDAACTVPTTTINLDDLDRLDTTTWSLSQPLYVKYTGSKEGNMYLTVLSWDFPTGFKAEWSYFSTWKNLGETEQRDFVQGDVIDLQLRVKQLEENAEGTYDFNFEFTIQDTA